MKEDLGVCVYPIFGLMTLLALLLYKRVALRGFGRFFIANLYLEITTRFANQRDGPQMLLRTKS